MRAGVRFAGPLLLLAGIVLVVLSVATGSATLYLLVIVPVVTGSSVTFALGTILVVLGIFLLPFLAVEGAPEELSGRGGPTANGTPGTAGAPGRPPASGSGGVVLLGPFPFFFGTWRGGSGARYVAAVALGALLTVAAFALYLYLAYRG
jgi:uncharacterized membrane protein